MSDKIFKVSDLATRAKWLVQDWAQWREYKDPTSRENLEQSIKYLIDFVQEDCLLPSYSYLMDDR
jgi:RIO-like serine/threonine protein kinase